MGWINDKKKKKKKQAVKMKLWPGADGNIKVQWLKDGVLEM